MSILTTRIHAACVNFGSVYKDAATDLFLPAQDYDELKARCAAIANEACRISDGPFETYGGMRVHKLAAGEKIMVAGRVVPECWGDVPLAESAKGAPSDE